MTNLDFSIKPEKAQSMNMVTFYDYYSRLRLLAITGFEWTGFDDSVNTRHLEQCLFDRGRVFFFQDPALGQLVMAGTPIGEPNLYMDPIDVRATARNGQNWDLKKDEYVMIRNNYDCQPTDSVIRLFATRLANAERTLDININAQRTPFIMVGEKKEIVSMKTMYRQYEGNEPVLYAALGMNPEMLKTIPTMAPYVGDKLMIYKKNLWNEAMTFLGINNANTDKRERLVVPEVEANDQLVDSSATVMLAAREEAAAAISKKFGISVSVKLRGPAREVLQAAEPEKEGETVE